MFAKERQQKIYLMLKEKNAVTTSALVELFGVSIETVRRDLLEIKKWLAHQGAWRCCFKLGYETLYEFAGSK